MHYDNYNLHCVALRKESVDRNSPGTNIILSTTVALRKESVDRNTLPETLNFTISRSLSARRAWIEIYLPIELSRERGVALRKESVDRNLIG